MIAYQCHLIEQTFYEMISYLENKEKIHKRISFTKKTKLTVARWRAPIMRVLPLYKIYKPIVKHNSMGHVYPASSGGINGHEQQARINSATHNFSERTNKPDLI